MVHLNRLQDISSCENAQLLKSTPLESLCWNHDKAQFVSSMMCWVYFEPNKIFSTFSLKDEKVDSRAERILVSRTSFA